MKFKNSLVTKILALVMAFLFGINIVSSWWIYGQIKKDAQLQLQRQIKATLYGISANIDGNEVEKLIEGGKEGNLYYDQLNHYLNKCLKSGDFKYLYTVAKQKDGQFIYCVDAAQPVDSDFVDFGTPLDVTADVGTRVVEQALREGVAFTEVQYFEEWGYLVTGYVALYDSSHEPVALLAIDLVASDYYQRINHLSREVGVTLGLVTLAISVILMIALIRSLRPLKKIQVAVGAVAQGNLEERLHIARKDEIGEIGRAINKMAEQLGVTIKVIRESGRKLMDSAGCLVIQSEEVREASRLVSIEAQEIRNQSEKDQHSLEETAEKMNSMQHHVEAIQGKSEEVLRGAIGSCEYAAQGSKRVSEATKTMVSITQTIQAANDEMGLLRRQIVEATKLVELIAKIANKSRILGLNAAIESTKQNGRGFQVVAKEIGDLAKESSAVASQTKDILEGIEKESQQAELMMNQTWEQMSMMEESALDIEKYFKEILGSNEHMKKSTQEVNEAMISYTGEAQIVLEQIKKAQQNALSLLAHCENISAFTQEQFATAEQLTDYAIALKSLAEMLEKSVQVFYIQ